LGSTFCFKTKGGKEIFNESNEHTIVLVFEGSAFHKGMPLARAWRLP
jgi:hypothetical protein